MLGSRGRKLTEIVLWGDCGIFGVVVGCKQRKKWDLDRQVLWLLGMKETVAKMLEGVSPLQAIASLRAHNS